MIKLKPFVLDNNQLYIRQDVHMNWVHYRYNTHLKYFIYYHNPDLLFRINFLKRMLRYCSL